MSAAINPLGGIPQNLVKHEEIPIAKEIEMTTIQKIEKELINNNLDPEQANVIILDVKGEIAKEGNAFQADIYTHPQDHKNYFKFDIIWKIIVEKGGVKQTIEVKETLYTTVQFPSSGKPKEIEKAKYRALVSVKSYRHTIKASLDPNHRDFAEFNQKIDTIRQKHCLTFKMIKGDQTEPEPKADIQKKFSAVVVQLDESTGDAVAIDYTKKTYKTGPEDKKTKHRPKVHRIFTSGTGYISSAEKTYRQKVVMKGNDEATKKLHTYEILDELAPNKLAEALKDHDKVQEDEYLEWLKEEIESYYEEYQDIKRDVSPGWIGHNPLDTVKMVGKKIMKKLPIVGPFFMSHFEQFVYMHDMLKKQGTPLEQAVNDLTKHFNETKGMLNHAIAKALIAHQSDLFSGGMLAKPISSDEIYKLPEQILYEYFNKIEAKIPEHEKAGIMEMHKQAVEYKQHLEMAEAQHAEEALQFSQIKIQLTDSLDLMEHLLAEIGKKAAQMQAIYANPDSESILTGKANFLSFKKIIDKEKLDLKDIKKDLEGHGIAMV